MKYRQATPVPPPPADATSVAGSLLDLAVRFIALGARRPEGTEQTLIKRAAQLLRLASQLVQQGTYDLELGQAWLDAGRLTYRRIEEGPYAHSR